MARVAAVPMRTPGMKVKKTAAPSARLDDRIPSTRRSKRESKQFVPFTGVDFTVKKEEKKKGGKKVKKEKKTPKVGVRKIGRGVEKKKGKTVKQQKEKKVSKKGNDRLVARPEIKFRREHASFGQSEFVSHRSFSRQLMGAVMSGDVKAIEKIYKDNRVPENAAGERYSCMDHRSPIVAAIQGGNEKVISTLLKCHQNRNSKKNVEIVLEPNLLKKKSTGQKNFHMLGRATRAIETARGGREGNNAFLNYEAEDVDEIDDNLLNHLDYRDTTYAFLSQLAKEKKKGGTDSILTDYSIQGQFLNALRSGNRSLAYDCAQLQSHNFNNLQLESLKPKGKIPKPILAISVRKKCFNFRNVTPVHTAAINPDPAFLSAFRDVDPVINVPDQNNWYTMHYAAVCEGDGPLKFLISKDIGVCDVNKQGELPLHLAAKTGRVANVKVLLEAIAKLEKSDSKNDENENDEEEDDEPRAKRAKKVIEAKTKKSIVNAKTRKGRTALHYAVWHGRTEVVKVLLANPSVDKECPNSANDKKLTPLMIAVGRGHLEIAEMLIAAGCLVEGRDKMKRSPLMLAAINGHSNIAAMLLQKGADVHRKDTSGNTAMHYACAYGWMDTVKLITKIDKETLAAKNEWLITPLSIAYLKGHYGIVSWLLENHSDVVDVNSKDNEGVTVISSLLSYHDEESTAHLPDQIDYLIKHGADCSITDTAGNSPLHIFAAVPIILKVEKPTRNAKGNDERITSSQYKKCIDQLVGAKADPLQKNSEGATPFSVALSAGNLYLASLLLDSYGKELLAGESQLVDKSNVLHTLLTVPQTIADSPALWAYADAPIGGQYNIVPMLKKIAALVGQTEMESLLGATNEEGYTPVLQMVTSLASLTNSHNMEASQFSAFSATVMAGLREILRLRPDAVMDRRKKKEDDSTPEEDRECVMKLALQGRQNKGKNFLLEALLSCAAENDNLAAFLTQKIGCAEAKCAVTPLVVTLLRKQQLEAVLILRAARDGSIAEEVCGAAIETRPVSGGEEEEDAPQISNGFNRTVKVARRIFRGKAGPGGFGAANPSTSAAQGTAVAVTQTEPWNKTAFHIAIENSLLETLPHFQLTNNQAAAVDSTGRNAWHYAADQLTPTTIKLFEMLEEKNVPIVCNSFGQNPLHVAVNAEKTGSADAFLDPIEWLLERVDPAALDNESRTALHYAFEKVDGKGKRKELRKQDPIAVVSLLLGKMSGKGIRQRDSTGNTALHLAAIADANICLVSMLTKGAEVDTRNNDDNSPLALALLAKSQAAALTLIQAHADINGPVLGPEPRKVEDKLYWYKGAPVHREERIRSCIPDTVVRNEWHSLVYVILDLLGKTPDTISKLVAAALGNGQHNFSLYLLKLLGKPTPEVQKAMVQHDFLSLYVENLAGPVEGPAATVLEKILELKVPFIDASGFSPVVEKACRFGHYQLLEKLAAADATRFETLKPRPGGSSPIQALVERWFESSSTQRATIRYWLQRFASFPGLNLEHPIGIPDRALPGSKDALRDDGTGNGCMISPLCAAIRAHDAELVKFLVAECKVDVNSASPLPPIADAIITNNSGVIKALVDGEMEDPHAVIPHSNGVANGTKAKRAQPFSFGVHKKQAARMAVDDDDEDEDEDNESEEEEEEESPVESDNEDAPSNGLGVSKPGKPIDLKGKIAALDITAKDRVSGRNVAHFLVDPCGWQNVELVEALVRVYKNKFTQLLTMRDNEGETPIGLAARMNQHKMYQAMVKNANRPTSDKITGLKVEVPTGTMHDVKSDSDNLVNEFAAVLKKKDEKKSRIPHKKSGYDKTGEIIECGTTNQLFQVLLNKTDIRGGLYGFHNYYKMELIKRKDADLFILFTNWGRIGDPYGEFQCTPFTNFDAAVKEFKSVFKQKTGQEWCPSADFVEKQGKYRLTKTEDNVQTAADVEIENFKLEKKDENVPEMKFIADISNVKQLRRYAHCVKLSNNSNVSCPFGRVGKEEIQKAREILDRLAKNIDEMNKARDKKPPNMNDIFRLTDEQYTLTSAFYTTIPVGGYIHSSIRVIDSSHELQCAQEILNTIGDIEIAGRLVSAATYAMRKRNEDPLRYILSAVDCSIQLQSPQEELSQRVMQWIAASNPSVDVHAIFSISSRRASMAMEKHKDCDNITYLLHGTKAENLLSILHYGLKATPSNSLQCGQAWGSGVYFADSFEKSEGYCGSSSQGLKYMLVCKVALGTVLTKDELEKKDKFDTRKVQGAKEPIGGLTIQGAEMPLGPLVDHKFTGPTMHWWHPPHNEFIVKDESRILPVMIIAFKN